MTSTSTRIGSSREAVSGDGALVGYETWGPIQQPGDPLNSRIFLYDATTGDTTEISSPDFQEPARPHISADGSTVAFSAIAASGYSEVFTYDVATGTSSQVTTDTTTGVGFGSSPTSIAADGRHVLYLSQTNEVRIRPGPWAVRVADTTTHATDEVVADAGQFGVFSPMAISPDGALVTFASDLDLTGDNPDFDAEVYLNDITSTALTQITNTDDGSPSTYSQAPEFIGGDAKIVFSSDASILGPPPDHDRHLYRYDLASGAFSAVYERGRFDTLSTDGSTDGFIAYRNRSGTNPDHSSEVFAHDGPSATTTQLTDGPTNWTSQTTAMAPSGNAVLFYSNGNYTGANPDHSDELFLATTCGAAPKPDARIAILLNGPDAGNNIYSSVPRTSQQRSATIAPASTGAFCVRLQNDRSATDNLAVRGVDTGSPGYFVTYRRGSTNITAAVRAGTYRTGPLAPGQFATISVFITAYTAGAGSTRTVDLTATSRTNPVTRDTVRAKVTRT